MAGGFPWLEKPTIFSSIFNYGLYVNAKWALRDIAGEQNKDLREISFSGHLSMRQDGLIAKQPHVLTSYVMTQDAYPNDVPTLMKDCDGWRDIIMNVRVSSTEYENRHISYICLVSLNVQASIHMKKCNVFSIGDFKITLSFLGTFMSDIILPYCRSAALWEETNFVTLVNTCKGPNR